MRETVVCYLLRGNAPREVLLGFKKTGFGAGKYAGFGGKVEPGETPEAAMVRELAEESGIIVPETALRPAGFVDFTFPYQPAWSQRMFIYVVESWRGEPTESREMRPEWFPLDAPPLDRMWSDAAHWLPPVLAGRSVTARISFAADNEQVSDAAVTVR